MNNYVLFAIAIPALGSLISALFSKKEIIRDFIFVATSIVTFLVVCKVGLLFSGIHNFTLIQIYQDLAINFQVEYIGLLFAFVASFLWIPTTLYAIGYMKNHNEKNITRFFVFFGMTISATLGAAFSGNLVTLFMFYEFITFLTYPLVTHQRNTIAIKSGRFYIGILTFTSVTFFLGAILLVYLNSGNTDFTIGGSISGNSTKLFINLLTLLFLFGIAKAGVMPFHKWLPRAMVAPTPVSALLHAVAVVKTGVFAVVKIFIYTIGVNNLSSAIFYFSTPLGQINIIEIIAVITIITASAVALKQNNIKARLAYSTVSQLSYIILVASLFSQLSMVAAGMHIFAHAFSKIILFFAAGAIMVANHESQINRLDGMAIKMPLTFFGVVIGVFSIIGLPPTIGFVSKWYILLASLEQGNYFAMIVLVLSSLLNAMYLIPLFSGAIFQSNKVEPELLKGYKEAPWTITLPIVFVAILCVAGFFYGQYIFHFLNSIKVPKV